MQAGLAHWQMVTPESTGVPRGGPFGDVARFVAEAATFGMKVCWSRIWRCFALYTQRHGRPVFQILLKGKEDRPLRLTRRILLTLRQVWSNHTRQTSKTIGGWMVQRAKDERDKELARQQADRHYRLKQITDRVTLELGYRKARIISLPPVKRLGGLTPQQLTARRRKHG